MILRRLWFIFCLTISFQPYAQQPIAFNKKKLIFKDGFSKKLNSNNWRTEMPPHESNRVFQLKGKLWIDTKVGVTVWYTNVLPENYCIEYKRCVIVNAGKNDRLSDVNNFWQASDPINSNLFTRNGTFESYDDLQMYYAAIGGNYNTTTRFRKYSGNKEKPVIGEYLDSAHLLKANYTYKIRIVYLNGSTQLFVDGNLWFTYSDPHPLPAGYFGLRSTKSRQWIDDVKIWEIE